MLGVEELKEDIRITDKTVECPVKACSIGVERQRGEFRRDDTFKCPKHHIFISPSTFEYEDYRDNLLWKDRYDLQLLDKIFEVKRESRMARDNSEDAVTWNVFRFLEKNNPIDSLLSKVTGQDVNSSEVIYWSYSQEEDKAWTMLYKAREEFGETVRRGSEPDLIIKTNKALFFIEAKLGASNETTPTDKNNSKKYETGGNNWFKQVFTSDYNKIAIDEKKYELMRFWLLGTWIAQKLGLRFYLINLTLEDKEKDIEERFKKHIKGDENKKFFRLTWEDIYEYVSTAAESSDKQAMLGYFRNKSVGYGKNGKLQKAFLI